jgi:hypothetical protein
MNGTIENSHLETVGTTTSAVIGRTSVATGLTYEALVVAFERELGRWEPATEKLLLARKAPWSEVEREVARMGGPRGLMVIHRIDQGAITSLSGNGKRCLLYLVGNPVIANGILDSDPRAGLYVPFRVCLSDDEGPGGAFLLYDRPSSSLAALGLPELAAVGSQLDGKIDGVAQALVALGRPAPAS